MNDLAALVSKLTENMTTMTETTGLLLQMREHDHATIEQLTVAHNHAHHRIGSLEALLAEYATIKGDGALLKRLAERQAEPVEPAAAAPQAPTPGRPDVIPFPG